MHKALRGCLASQDHKALLALPARTVRKDLKDLRVRSDLLAHRVSPVLKVSQGLRVKLVHKVLPVSRVSTDPWGLRASRARPDLRVCRARSVQPDHPDRKDLPARRA